MPYPSFPLCVVVVAAASAQAAALAHWQSPCHGATTPAIGGRTVVLWESCTRRQSSKFFEFIGAGSSFSLKDALTTHPPLRASHCKWLCPQVALLPAGAAPASCCPYVRQPPLAGAVGLPFGLALAAASRPLTGPWPRPGRGWPALHGSWPWLVAPPPHCLRCENAARTRRTILRDIISSHAV
ncbi:hypothetical protein BHM03_00031133 [Ensete ventricosum]|nr:hypothetical protein BHM03_00031133 [Ensete ventricosum]